MQENAISYNDKPLLVIAGPGTGKTHTLTNRIAHFVEHKSAKPENILAITFTNKAAQEMSQRIEKKIKGA